MKRLPFFIASGVGIIALAALAAVWYQNRRRTLTADNVRQGPDYMLGGNSNAATVFKGFNYNTVLSDDAVQSEAEITLLQKFINAYYGTQTVPVTGRWNQATENAVEAVTGKPSTSLYEFQFVYLTPYRGAQVGIDIIDQTTEQ